MAGRYSPFDLTDRRAAGHPNGYCGACGRPASSPGAEYCSPGCRGRAAEREACEAALEEERRARVTTLPDEEIAAREPERPDEEPPAPARPPEVSR